MEELSKEYLEFRKELVEEPKKICSCCKRSMVECYCNRVHTSVLGKVFKVGNPDNYFRNNLQNIKINQTLLGDKE